MDLSPGASPAAANGNREDRIRAELVASLFDLSEVTRFQPFIPLFALLVVFWNTLPDWQSLFLLFSYSIATYAYHRLRKAWKASRAQGGSPDIWARRFTVLSAITGSIWGLASWFCISVGSPAQQIFAATVAAVMAVSSVVNRSAYLPSYLAFVTPIVVGNGAAFFLQGFRQGDTAAIATGASAFALLIALQIWARTLYRSQREVIELRFDRSELIERLQVARAAAEAGRAAAEAGDRAKSEFLATIGHELRTPLNGILGMTRLLLAGRLEDEQRAQAETVRESGEALLTLINDLLDYSRLEAGRVELEQIAFDPQEIVKGVVVLLAPRAFAKRISVAFHVSPRVPTQLVGDPARLRQVLLNLVGNAVKFTEAGSIGVAADRDEGGRLLIEVSDTGIGIAPQVRDRLFDRFSQADASISRRYGGSGLGLAICRRLVEIMGGDISVESEVGVGSQFRVRLPMKAVVGNATKVAEPTPRFEGRQALVVANEGPARTLLLRQLADWGISGDACATADAAIRLLSSSRRHDFAVLDDFVPQTELRPLFERMRRQASFPPGIVMLSGGVSLLPDAIPDGVAVIAKPCLPSSLARTVAGVLVGEPQNGADTAEDGGGRSGLSILVVDDVPTNQRLAAALLGLAGHKVDVAANGDQAIAAARARAYDVILMDLEMPVIDGLTAAAAIRALPGAAARVPIVAMSAHSPSEYGERARAAGMVDFLTKPIDADDLLRTVQRVARQATPEVPPDRLSVDYPALERLRDSLGEAETAALVRGFVEDGRAALRRIADATAREAWSDVLQEAHGIAGSSGSYGLIHMSELARALSQAARANRPEDVRRLTAELVAAGERALARLEAWR